MTLTDPATRDTISDVALRLDALRRSFDEGVRSAPGVDAQRVEEYLLLVISGEAYAYPVRYALEIAPVPAIVPMPGLPPAVLGIVNCRGQVLSITTIHGELGLRAGDCATGGRMIVTKDLPLVTGILVDRVEAILEVAMEDITPIPATMREDRARLLGGQTHVGDRLVFLLEVEQICRLESLYVTPARLAAVGIAGPEYGNGEAQVPAQEDRS